MDSRLNKDSYHKGRLYSLRCGRTSIGKTAVYVVVLGKATQMRKLERTSRW